MRSDALSTLSIVLLATSTTAASQYKRQDLGCLGDIVSSLKAIPTTPSALSGVVDCVPATLSEAASSFSSEAGAWYSSIASAISDCPAFPATDASSLTPLPTGSLTVCTGEQASRGAATATLSSTSSNAVATNTNPTRSGTTSRPTVMSSSAPHSSAASGSATRAATASSSQSANAAARETGVIFAAVAVAALGAAAL